MERSELTYNYEVTNQLGQAITGGERGLRAVPGLLKKILKENLWQERYVRETKQTVKFKKFAEFVAALPLEGLGSDVKTLRRLCADDEEATEMLRAATTGEHGGDRRSEEIKVRNTNLDSDVNPSTDDKGYALRRLRKDRPDLHAQVIEKKLSPHAAMVEAGFRPKTITVPVDTEKAAAVIVRNFKGDTTKLIQAIQKLLKA